MEQLISTNQLAEKLTKDMLFDNGYTECRISLDVIDNLGMQRTWNHHLHLRGFTNGSHIYTIPFDSKKADKNFQVHYSIITTDDKTGDNDLAKVGQLFRTAWHLSAQYKYTDQAGNLIRMKSTTNEDCAEDTIYNSNSNLIGIITVFRYSATSNIVYPVMYYINLKEIFYCGDTQQDFRYISLAEVNNSIACDIIDNFIHGTDKFKFTQIFKGVKYTVEYPVIFEGKDEEIVNGFDPRNTAEYFAVADKVNENKDTIPNINYSWNPDTKLLSVNKYIEDQKCIMVDLYYTEDPDAFIEERESHPKKVFSYKIATENPALCFIIRDDEEFYQDEHVKVRYTTRDVGTIDTFEYILDDEVIIAAAINYTSPLDKEIFSYQVINNNLINDNILVNGIMTRHQGESNTLKGQYSSTELKFSFVDNIMKIPEMQSYIYSFDNLYIRSIAWNLVKIL